MSDTYLDALARIGLEAPSTRIVAISVGQSFSDEELREALFSALGDIALERDAFPLPLPFFGPLQGVSSYLFRVPDTASPLARFEDTSWQAVFGNTPVDLTRTFAAALAASPLGPAVLGVSWWAHSAPTVFTAARVAEGPNDPIDQICGSLGLTPAAGLRRAFRNARWAVISDLIGELEDFSAVDGMLARLKVPYTRIHITLSGIDDVFQTSQAGCDVLVIRVTRAEDVVDKLTEQLRARL